ncbi:MULTISPECIES: putative cation transport regulator ChaB [Microbulbifer]|nr:MULTISPECIES: putative cation transport regulator ChaB [Microbulbifer]
MPYDNRSDLPDAVKNSLPPHAQSIYKEAFNSAWDQYKDPEDRREDRSREETAHAVAWSAVKEEYEKSDDGNWKRKH